MLSWNEAFWSLNLSSAKAGTLATLIASYSSPEGLFWAKLSAASLMAIAPIVVVGWFSQKQLVQGPDLRRRQVTQCSQEIHHGLPANSRASRSSSASLRAIKGVDLKIEKGEFVVFVGPSGCGKSTLLRMIAGLTEIDGGSVNLDGRDITKLPSSKRDLAMVFQSYALYPHMSVFDNMSFALRLANVDKKVIQEKVGRAAEILNLTHYLQRTPKELSGGQRQRVAIGRAIVRAPKVFLFDEPLSNLDAALRGQTRVEIAKLHRDLGATTIYVTHDQVEAMTLADRVVVLRDGADRAGRLAAGAVRPAGEPVRRAVHRHAADERDRHRGAAGA